MWSIRSTHIIKKLQYLEYLSAVVEWMYFATFLHCLWSTFPRSLNHSVTPQASALTMFLHSFIHASPHSSESKLPTLNSPLPPLTSLIVSLHHTPSGPQLKRRWRAVERGVGGWGLAGGRRVESIQLSVNQAQAHEPLNPQPSCYQLTLTPTQSDAIILLQRLYWHRGFKDPCACGPIPFIFQRAPPLHPPGAAALLPLTSCCVRVKLDSD